MPDTTTERPVLKVSEAAALMGLSVREVYYLVEGGAIEHIRYPSRGRGDDGPIRIERAVAEAYKAAHRRPATSP